MAQRRGTKPSSYEFFYATASPYSNFHPAAFRMRVDGTEYRYACSEQAMMHCKALLFKDKATAAKLVASPAPQPKRCKALGRGVRGFDPAVWDEHKMRIVRTLLKCKFGQGGSIRKTMLATGSKTLVEASPADSIWGIGLSATKAKAMPASSWPGQNLLGIALTEVRDEIARDLEMGEEKDYILDLNLHTSSKGGVSTSP